MVALNIGTGIIPHQKKNIMPDNDLRPEKKKRTTQRVLVC
jgi:hypothetical protein